MKRTEDWGGCFLFVCLSLHLKMMLMLEAVCFVVDLDNPQSQNWDLSDQ